MAKSQYVGVDGVARKVDTGYVGVDGVARKLTKGYVGVDGVARECFNSGIIWKKYDCDVIISYEEGPSWSGGGAESSENGGMIALGYLHSYIGWNSSTGGLTFSNMYKDYTFTPEGGYQGTEVYPTTTCYTEEKINQVLNNACIIDNPTKLTWLSLESYSETEPSFELSAYGRSATQLKHYSPGKNLLGTILVTEGKIPQEGSLLTGSYELGYCVLEIEGTPYYYIADFVAKTAWNKYDTNYISHHYEEVDYTYGSIIFDAGQTCIVSFPVSNLNEDGSFDTSTIYNENRLVGSGYYFNDAMGYQIGSNTGGLEFTNNETLADLQSKCIGKYLILHRYNHSLVYIIGTINDYRIAFGSASGGVWIGGSTDGSAVAAAKEIEAHYEKGPTFYSTLISITGTLPENGTLIEGSVDDNYCVLKIDGTYYYYEKV